MSSLTKEGGKLALEAIERSCGRRFQTGKLYTVGDMREQLVAKIAAALARIPRPEAKSAAPPEPMTALACTTHKVIAIGASTGSLEA